jgi:TM2 domain-containing membrane protein YozV
MVTRANASRDPAHKALLCEVMKKNVGLITLISMFIPQIFLSQYLKGVLILLLSGLIVPWLYGKYDAYTTANKYNNELYMLIFPEPIAITTTSAQIQDKE